MIRYFDASALVKRYVAETHSDLVAELLADGHAATSRYSIVEIGSALARRTRHGDLLAADRDRAMTALDDDIDHLLIVELTPLIVTMACAVLNTRSLKAGDSLQLASALFLRDRTGRNVEFVCFDTKLNHAARQEGLELTPDVEER